MSAPCLLTALADENLAGVLPGMTLSEGELSLDGASFPCCAGTGRREADGVARDCDLKWRLASVRRLMTCFHKTWNAQAFAGEESEVKLVAPPLALARRDLRDVLTRLSQVGAASPAKGRAVSRLEGARGPGPLWAVAFAAAWRFGLTPHWVTLGRTDDAELLPKDVGPRGTVVFVEAVDRLWDARQLDQLEGLIGYCHGSLTPLWLEVIVRRKKSDETPARKPLRRMVEDMKARPPLAWLGPGARSKLAETTDGIERLGGGHARPRPRRAEVRLPWDP